MELLGRNAGCFSLRHHVVPICENRRLPDPSATGLPPEPAGPAGRLLPQGQCVPIGKIPPGVLRGPGLRPVPEPRGPATSCQTVPSAPGLRTFNALSPLPAPDRSRPCGCQMEAGYRNRPRDMTTGCRSLPSGACPRASPSNPCPTCAGGLGRPSSAEGVGHGLHFTSPILLKPSTAAETKGS